MVFPLQIHLYGFLIGIAIITAVQIVEWIVKREKIPVDLNFAFIVVLLSGLVGARVYHLITDWQLYTRASLLDLLAVWNGGLGIVGAFVGGSIGLFVSVYLQKKIAYFWALLDALAVALPFSQSIGRWGNFLNQELYGKVTTLPWGIHIDSRYLPAGVDPSSRFHPLFLYESIAMFCIGLIVVWLYQKKHLWKVGSGKYFGLYGMSYSLVRFLLEFLRFKTACFPFFSTFSVAQFMMICLCCVSVLIFLKTDKKIV